MPTRTTSVTITAEFLRRILLEGFAENVEGTILRTTLVQALDHVEEAGMPALRDRVVAALPPTPNQEHSDPVVITLWHWFEQHAGRDADPDHSLHWLSAAHRYWLTLIARTPFAFSRCLLEQARRGHLPGTATVAALKRVQELVLDSRLRHLDPHRYDSLSALSQIYLAEAHHHSHESCMALAKLARATIMMEGVQERQVAAGEYRSGEDTELFCTIMEISAEQCLLYKPTISHVLLSDAHRMVAEVSIPGRGSETFMRLGLLYAAMQRWETAPEFLEHALGDDHIDLYAKVRALHHLGMCEYQRRRFQEALRAFDAAEPLYRPPTPPSFRAQSLYCRAGIAMVRREFDHSMDLLLQSAEIYAAVNPVRAVLSLGAFTNLLTATITDADEVSRRCADLVDRHSSVLEHPDVQALDRRKVDTDYPMLGALISSFSNEPVN